MVFASLNPPKNTYKVWQRFRMPTSGGSKDAVAVTAEVGDQLLAAYTFLLSHIVLLTWWIAIIIALFIFAEIHKHHLGNSKLHVKIWNKRSSPYRIVKLAFYRFLWPQPKSKQQSDTDPRSSPEPKPSRLYLLLWFLIGISFLVVKFAVPIYFARFIKLGNAAPVSKDAIYVPSLLSTQGNPDVPPTPQSILQSILGELQVRELFIPSAIRALGDIDTANDTFKGEPPVEVDQPEILGTDADGEVSMRIGYRYNVTGLDLGLQHYPDLLLNVEGACMTEYDWWVSSTTNDSTLPGAFVETYKIFGQDYKVSKYDGGSPIAQFYYNSSGGDDATNTSWAALISSVNRSSYTVGTDPFYRTGPNPFAAADPDNSYYGHNMVLPRRPVLSCWENNVWSLQGRSSSVGNLDFLPSGLAIILGDFISNPMVYSVGGYLGQSALKSSTTSLADVFDANHSTIYADLERLLFASYIATANIFTETTLFDSNTGIINDLISSNGSLYLGASDFVIFSSKVDALSVKALIIIPTITVGLWTILTITTCLPHILKMVTSFYGGEEEKEKKKDKEDEEQENKKKDNKEDEEEEKKKKKDRAKHDILQPAKDDIKDVEDKLTDSIKDSLKDQVRDSITGMLSPDDDD